jgi:multiple sugar transport system substrate-binding protein
MTSPVRHPHPARAAAVRKRPVRSRRMAAVLALVTLALTACGGAGTLRPPDISQPAFGQHATGTVQLWVRAATQAASAPIVASFNKSHPDLHVVLTAIPDTQYITKLSTAIRGRSVPDAVDIDDINSTLLAYHEALTNITPLAKKLPYLKQLSPGHLNLATYNGQIYAVPYAADISVLYYNKNLFQLAGLDPTKPPTSLDEVLTDARAINKLGKGVKGFSFGGDSPGIMGFTALPSVWASKSHLFEGSLGHQTAHISDNPALRKMLQFYRDVWVEGLSQPTSRTETGATWGKDFLAGKVGLFPGNEGVLAAGMTPAFAKDVGAIALPGAISGSSVFVGGDNIAIPRGAKNASGAWEYIQYALQIAQQSTLPKAGFTPIRADVATPKFDATYPRTAVALKALSTGYAEKTLAYNTAVNQVSGPWFTLFTAAVFGGHVNQALKQAQTGFARALKQAQT